MKSYLLPNLEKSGIPCHIDYRDFEIGLPSLINMERAVETCEKTILVLSPNWVKSEFAQFEGVMLQTESPLNLKKKIIPLMLSSCDLPKRLSIFTYADFSEESEQSDQFKRLIGQIKKDFAELNSAKIQYAELSEEHIYTERLPLTGFALFGRQKELQLLNEAWDSGKIHVVSFVAYGGMGKSTLLNKWLEKMRWDHYRGAERVYAWSFYSQGTNEYVSSADQFIHAALKWFGDENPEAGSAWDKGKRLAKLIGQRKTLLILDGLEPLQSGLDVEKGAIKDPALAMLIKDLAKRNRGLCIISTRENVPELRRYPKTTKQEDLEQISDEAGRKLLELRGVRGSEGELEQAVHAFGNHALAVSLLAEYLHLFPGHGVQKAFEIPDLDIPIEKGRHPRRVIEAFALQFGASSPEVALLSLLGLFDHPVEHAALDAVLGEDSIPGLTEALASLDATHYLQLLEGLRKIKLIAPKSSHRPDTLDCHPLVREHFGEGLKNGKPEAWRAAHGRLYDYYKNLPEKALPDTLEEMEPLFAAVRHGCLAERHQEALEDVYWERIRRKEKAYTVHLLGAFGADLNCVSSFFESLWSIPIETLSNLWQADALNWAGFRLRALGRLREAVQPMRAGLEMRIKQENWAEAALEAGNISELLLTMGDLQAAETHAIESVNFSDRSEDDFQMESKRTTVANIYHQMGNLDAAKVLFKEAEHMHQQRRSEYPYFYSVQGFEYCDLLLSLGRFQEVRDRAETTLKYGKEGWYYLLGIALDQLSLGQTALFQNLQEESYDFSEAEPFLNEAVVGLRKAGTQHYLPRGLLARAGLYRHQRRFLKSWADLDEAHDIAAYGGMKLYLADYALEACRNIKMQLTVEGSELTEKSFEIIEDGETLSLSRIEMEGKFKGHFDEAARLIEACGYHRRDAELEALRPK